MRTADHEKEEEEEALAAMVTVMKGKQQEEEKQRVLMGNNAGLVALMSPSCVFDGRWGLVPNIMELSCHGHGARGSHGRRLKAWTLGLS